MSFEKFLIDEELCGMVNKLLVPVEVSEQTLQEQVIRRVGIGGEFLSQVETLERCRTEFFTSELMRALDFNAWKSGGARTTAERAGDLLVRRLASFEKPDIDPGLESDLAGFVRSRKG
jgi:trimethylamine--corrinoid protein Co-methyltransferase